MRGAKLDFVRKTLLFVVDQLKECDRLSLVTYDTNVYLDFSLTSMSTTNKDKAKITISNLREGSSTNLCGGLVKGMEEVVQSAGERAQVQSVLLLTDGLANKRVRDAEGILAKMRELQDPPVRGDVAPKKFNGTVYTFGSPVKEAESITSLTALIRSRSHLQTVWDGC
ncbi:Inter-alpha-trypsin inhibitor heavy chain H1 [Geodia barretti]|uniref:Inter-alpha-trypsin inhibitor heavy chain H1 n=1 Tax=Geodia barretti TaxID=519541 RepID=A0AA35X3I2_GEOBA|nr:Inter-alpha-trypsin inhibitor heavy chain H1 [Geodia barretti]